MNESDIAPCGMNCSLCVSYQAREKDLNKKGFHRGYCPGCIERGRNCLHMADSCKLLGDGLVRYCFDCDTYPCPRLDSQLEILRTKKTYCWDNNPEFAGDIISLTEENS